MTIALLDERNSFGDVDTDDLAAALETWVKLQHRRVTVADAMAVFNVTQLLILEAMIDVEDLVVDWPDYETDPSKQRIGVSL